MRRGEIDDGEVEACFAEFGSLVHHGAEVGFWRHEDVLRDGDLVGVTADHLALLFEQAPRGDQIVGVSSGEVPVLGVAGHERQCSAGASASDADGRVGSLHRFGFASGCLESVMLSVVIGRFVGEQRGDHVDRFFETVETLGERTEFDPVGAALLLVPSRAESEFETPSRHDVEGGGHVGEHGGVSVDDAVDHGSDAYAFGGLGQGGEGDPSLEAGAGGVVGVDGVEVVEVPGRLEEFDAIGFAPDVEHVAPCRLLRGGFDRVAHVETLGERLWQSAGLR